MPSGDYVIHDTVTGNYVSAYTDVAHFTPSGNECPLIDIGLVPIRDQATCNSIASDLNAAYSAGRFAVGPRPK